MPRTTWIHSHAPEIAVPPPDMVVDLIARYQAAQKLTAKQLGERLGVNAQRVRWKKHHGGGTFTVDELRQWCKALGITSAEEVGRAILYE